MACRSAAVVPPVPGPSSTTVRACAMPALRTSRCSSRCELGIDRADLGGVAHEAAQELDAVAQPAGRLGRMVPLGTGRATGRAWSGLLLVDGLRRFWRRRRQPALSDGISLGMRRWRAMSVNTRPSVLQSAQPNMCALGSAHDPRRDPRAARSRCATSARRVRDAGRRHPVRAALLLPALVLLYVLVLIPFTPSIGDLRKAKSEAPSVRDVGRRRGAGRVQAHQPRVGAAGEDLAARGRGADRHRGPPLLRAPRHRLPAHRRGGAEHAARATCRAARPSRSSWRATCTPRRSAARSRSRARSRRRSPR